MRKSLPKRAYRAASDWQSALQTELARAIQTCLHNGANCDRIKICVVGHCRSIALSAQPAPEVEQLATSAELLHVGRIPTLTD